MKIWTHRGNPWPENSIEAFEHSYNLGIRHFETDVHVTRDGVLVLSHDSHLGRVTECQLEVGALSFDELRQHPIAGSASWTSLTELHARFKDVMISIDMKSNETVDPMIRWLKGRDHENFVIGSFFGGRVQTIRENFPMIRTSLTPREISTVLWSRRMPKNSSSAPRFAMVPETFKGLRVVNERFVEDCHRLDVEVHVWVINSLEKMNDLSRMGVDGIVTDNPCLGTYHLG